MASMTHETGQSEYRKLAEMILDIRVAMLTTFPIGATAVGRANAAQCRPMHTQTVDPETFDGTLWFMTDADSGKVYQLVSNPAVLITYSDPGKNRYVVVRGTGRVEHNPQKARELWNIHAKGWYPDGPTDSDLALIEVTVDSAEYWEGPSWTSYFLGLFKAVATGQRNKVEANHGTI